MKFIDNLFGSKTRTHLLRLFFRNPDEVFSIHGIADHLGIKPREAEKEILVLKRLGILIRKRPLNGSR